MSVPQQPRPSGLVKVVACKQRNPDHAHAVYVDVVLEDEDGKRWVYQTASFLFELKPYDEQE